MQRRSFLAKAALSASAIAAPFGFISAKTTARTRRQWFELTRYDLKPGGAAVVEAYLTRALLPSMGRMGAVATGVFREREKTEEVLYTLTAYPHARMATSALDTLRKDSAYVARAASHFGLSAEEAPYTRKHTSLLCGIEGAPGLRLPARTDTYFELRIYEGQHEDAVRRKIGMFNAEELTLFRSLNMDPVFFGETYFGPDGPNLVYMLSYPDEAAREARWKQFIDHPEWHAMRDKPEYANTVSKVIRINLVKSLASEF